MSHRTNSCTLYTGYGAQKKLREFKVYTDEDVETVSSIYFDAEGKGNSEEIHKLRNTIRIENNKLLEDVQLTSPSAAGGLLIGAACNGWSSWKDAAGKSLDYYRTHSERK